MNGAYYNRAVKLNFPISRLRNLIKNHRFNFLISIFIMSIMIFSLSIISTTVNAERSLSREKVIASIKVEEGDSLWSIASEYITDEYDSMDSYIKEIQRSNGLTSEVIHEGSYIIVPYYKSAR